MIELPKSIALYEPKVKKNPTMPPAARAILGIVMITITMLLVNVALAQMTVAESNPPSTATEMDQAIELLDAARLRFKKVKDYDCHLLKQERVKGVLLPESVMTMKVRNKPFSVYLHFESPSDDKGLAVCYVEGRNRGKMRVRPPGIRGILDFWSVDLDDPRAFQKNRHCIKEAGIGNLLESTARYWEMERSLNKTIVHITDDQVDGSSCIRIETIHPDPSAGEFYGYRCVLWLDNVTGLPVGAETYDWPRRGSSKEGDLLESYRYLDLRLNIGLNDVDFRH